MSRARQKRSRRGELGRILFWAGVSNVLLVGVIFAGMHRDTIPLIVNYFQPHHNFSVANLTPDPMATSRLERSDNEMSSSKMQPARKGGISMTRIHLSGVTDVPENGYTADAAALEEEASAGPVPTNDAAASITVPMPTTEQTLGLKVAPILGKDERTGHLKIGNFKPISLTGNMDECLNVGYSMLGDSGSSNDLLNVMTASEQITIAKICATNGSIIISCRGDQITVSPRRSRPDDKCAATN